jgi:hypothetical protein
LRTGRLVTRVINPFNVSLAQAYFRPGETQEYR